MRFASSLLALVAMAASAIAQEPTKDFDPIYKPATGDKIAAGSDCEIVWSAPEKYAKDTISIFLLAGASTGTLVEVKAIASGVNNADAKYVWPVPKDVGDKPVYGFKFKLDRDTSIIQYSMPFHITGGQGVKTIVLSSTKMDSVPTTSAAQYAAPTTMATSAVTTSAVAIKSVVPGVVVPPQASVDCGKNATATGITKPTGYQTVPSNTSVAPAAGTSAVTVQTAGAASLAGAGFMSLAGGLVVAALAL